MTAIAAKTDTNVDAIFIKKGDHDYNSSICHVVLNGIPFAIIHRDYDIAEASLKFDYREWNVINIAELKAKDNITIQCVHYIGLGALVEPRTGKFNCHPTGTYNSIGVQFNTGTGVNVEAKGQVSVLPIKPSERSLLIREFRKAIERQDGQLVVRAIACLRGYIGQFYSPTIEVALDVDRTIQMFHANNSELLTKKEKPLQFARAPLPIADAPATTALAASSTAPKEPKAATK